MADAEPTGLGEVSVSVSMLPAASVVSDEEEEKEEDEESGHVDDEEERPQRVDIRKNVRRIAKHDVSDRGMKAECTHVCVYCLSDGEEGDKRHCNTPLKLFRSSKGKEATWSTSDALGHLLFFSCFFRSKASYNRSRICRSRGSDYTSGLE
jgi:hypothetical protein